MGIFRLTVVRADLSFSKPVVNPLKKLLSFILQKISKLFFLVGWNKLVSGKAFESGSLYRFSVEIK